MNRKPIGGCPIISATPGPSTPARPGSLLLAIHAASDQPTYEPEQVKAARHLYEEMTGQPRYLRTRQESTELVLSGCVLMQPGLVTTAAWQPDLPAFDRSRTVLLGRSHGAAQPSRGSAAPPSVSACRGSGVSGYPDWRRSTAWGASPPYKRSSPAVEVRIRRATSCHPVPCSAHHCRVPAGNTAEGGRGRDSSPRPHRPPSHEGVLTMDAGVAMAWLTWRTMFQARLDVARTVRLPCGQTLLVCRPAYGRSGR